MIPDRFISRDGRLMLRRPEPSDAQRHFKIYSDPATNLYNPNPLSRREDGEAMLQDWMDHWQEHGFGPWTISTAMDTSRAIGFGGLSWRPIAGTRRLNLGYRFGTDAWGHGYATEMGQTAIDLALGTLAVEVFAYVRPNNSPSIRVLDRLSMVLSDTFDDFPG